jgi:hypothetical protein
MKFARYGDELVKVPETEIEFMSRWHEHYTNFYESYHEAEKDPFKD